MIRNLVIALLILCLGGIVIHPLRKHVLEEEKALLLLPAPLMIGQESSRIKKLDQQLSFLALGGLRSLVAAFLNVSAHDYFMSRNWPALEERFRNIVALAPQNTFYWDIGAWHLGYNASSDSRQDISLRETERNIRFRSYINKGREFLKEGLENNPDDWYLYSRLGDTYSDIYRITDYPRAAEAYRKAFELSEKQNGKPIYMLRRSELYSLANIPGEEWKSYEMARELVLTGAHKVPSTQSLLFAYQILLNIPPSDRMDVREIFPSPKSAHWSLSRYLTRENNYPREGIGQAVKILEPYANSAAWDDMPHSDLEKLSDLGKLAKPNQS